MVAMGCRSLDFAAVASESGLRGGRKRIWASPISLSPDCVTGLRGGLELGRTAAPRTSVAHMIDDLQRVLRWIAMGLIEWVLL
uniref:Uncharacterized protein n=1 Tax=Fagus sylvatica TaxID=28930 RepID=A0A2N9HPK8_FAGSY